MFIIRVYNSVWIVFPGKSVTGSYFKCICKKVSVRGIPEPKVTKATEDSSEHSGPAVQHRKIIMASRNKAMRICEPHPGPDLPPCRGFNTFVRQFRAPAGSAP